MKLKAQLKDVEHEISLELADEKATVEIDGRPYEVEVRELSKGEYLLVHNTNVYRCRLNQRASHFEVTLRGRSHDIAIVDPKRLRSGQAAGKQSHGSAEIISPMPGKVVRILAETGTQVEVGAGIIVIEAMKMQNELKSPKTGTVVSINGEVGQTVNAGEVLAVIE